LTARDWIAAIVSLLIVFVAGGCGAGQLSSSAEDHPQGSLIVFQGEDGDWRAVEPDGSALHRFALPAGCIDPLSFSNNGRFVACSDTWPTIGHIDVIAVDGSRRQRLHLPDGSAPADAALSTDGQRLVYTNARDTDSFEIWRIGTNDDDAKLLVADGVNGHPSWSPEGESIAFERLGKVTDCAAGDSVATDLNGDGRQLLAKDTGNPRWSPDGRWAAFVDHCGTITARRIGGRGTTLVAVGAYTPEFAWSPDGQEIAFEREAQCSSGDVGSDPCVQLFVVPVIAGNPRPVAAAMGSDLFWIPRDTAPNH
jgi:dipeptidyl aminopeptidase/acylaminoacyl peptidase